MLQPQVFVAEVLLLSRLSASMRCVISFAPLRWTSDRDKVFPSIDSEIAVAITLDMVQWLRLRRLWLFRPGRCLDHPGHAFKSVVMLGFGNTVWAFIFRSGHT